MSVDGVQTGSGGPRVSPGPARAAIVSDPLPDGASVREHGFSLKLRDPRAERLFFEGLRASMGEGLGGKQMVETQRARPRPAHRRGVAREKRDPLVNFDHVRTAFYVALARNDIEPASTESWEPIIVQTRISQLEGGKSTSPERQVENIAAWCAKNGFRPEYLVHEETSGSIYRKRRRTEFERFFNDIQHEQVRDPKTGEPIRAIACSFYDRFTRDPDEGSDWIRLLRSKKTDLHETYYGEPPRPLARAEHDIRQAWNVAAKEVKLTVDRRAHWLKNAAEHGLPVFGVKQLWGHTAISDPSTGKIVRYQAVPELVPVFRRIVDDIIAGQPIFTTVRWLNDHGYSNSVGNLWSYSNLERLLRAPRTAGLMRLRTNTDRYHDPDYEGELYPEELLVEPGESPPPGFESPIEPLIDYPTWQKLQSALDARQQRKGPPTTYLASDLLECAVCGSSVCGMHSGRRKHYRCTRRKLLHPLRPQSAPAQKTAPETRHPTMRRDNVDFVVTEMLFAVVARDPDPAQDDEAQRKEARRETIRAQLMTLDERLGNVSYMHAKLTITRAQFDELAQEIRDERSELEGQLRLVEAPAERATLPDGVTLRDLWPGLDIAQRKRWLEIVFERIVLHPAPAVGYRGIIGRLEFRFRGPYEPPPDELAQLLFELDDVVRFKNAPPSPLGDQLEERLYSLHKQGYTTGQIKNIFDREGVKGPLGGAWVPSNIGRSLKRICRGKGETYVRNVRIRTQLSIETRRLLVELWLTFRKPSEVADELNRLGIPTATGKTWTAPSVNGALRTHALARLVEEEFASEFPQWPPKGDNGARRSLTPTLRAHIAQLRRDGMTYAAIARWLDDAGIRTRDGGPWDLATVRLIINATEGIPRPSSRKEAVKRASG